MAEIAFIGATLIDGTGSAPRPNAVVLVQRDRISWTGSAADFQRPSNTEVIDVTGKYLIPGLMDANVHLLFVFEPELLLQFEIGEWDSIILEAAQVALKSGITTVFDTWGPLDALRRVRDRINQGSAIGSRILFGGNIIGNGGPWSPDFVPDFGKDVRPEIVEQVNWHWAREVGDELPWMSSEDVRSVVRDYIASSEIDFVKYASHAHAPFAKQFIALGPDAQRAIVEEAHAAGLTVQACVGTPESLKLAMRAGVDLVQHANSTGRRPLPAQALDEIVATQLPCVALLMTDRYHAAFPDVALRTRYQTVEQNARRMIKAGAKLMLATDGGVVRPIRRDHPWYAGWLDLPDSPYDMGEGQFLWLRAAIEREMAPMDALLAATRNIAEAYGKGNELGSIEAGKRADILVLDGNPLDDVENYRRIASVMKDGELIDRDRLPEEPVLTASSGERGVTSIA